MGDCWFFIGLFIVSFILFSNHSSSAEQCPAQKLLFLEITWKVHNSALQVLTFASDGICQPASFYSPHTSVLNNRPAVQFLAYSHLFSWYLHLSQNISFEQQHNNKQPLQQIRKQILVGEQQIQNGKLFASKAKCLGWIPSLPVMKEYFELFVAWFIRYTLGIGQEIGQGLIGELEKEF